MGGRGVTVTGATGAQDLDLKPALRAAANMEEAVVLLHDPLVAAMVAIIPNLDPADVAPSMTLSECNSDSMRGVNIDNWLRRTTGVSVGMGINAMTTRGLCEEVIRKGGFLNIG